MKLELGLRISRTHSTFSSLSSGGSSPTAAGQPRVDPVSSIFSEVYLNSQFLIFQRKFFYQTPSAVAFNLTQKFYYNTIFFCKHYG